MEEGEHIIYKQTGEDDASRENKPNTKNRSDLSSLRYRRMTTRRRIFEEEDNLTTADTHTIRKKAPEMLRTNRLSNSMRDIFRDLVNASSVDLPTGETMRLPCNNNKLSLTRDNEEYQPNTRKYLKSYIENVIRTEFPESTTVPTAKDVINIGNIAENKARYGPGSWVEIEGLDMKWRLDMITRVVRQAPDDFDWNDPKNEEIEPTWKFYYHAGIERKFREEDVRSPEEGLKRVFGNRPWVWQQWAILKLEEKIRFQQGHQYDCMEMDVQKYAADLWDQWLCHEDNAEFSNLFDDERVGEYGRSELRNHIMKPFYLIDRIKEDKNEWNFSDDNNISVFTYTSLLGAGFLVPFVVFVIQVAIPMLLVYEANRREGCSEDYNNVSRAMALIILTLYIFTVIPDTYARLLEVEGGADTTYSRLLSLRRELWKQGDDSTIQLIGFKMDVIMSTGYECLLSILNIYVIINTFETIDVVLNALAFVFIAEIDQAIVKSSWWDFKNRWITAGTIEVIMSTIVRLRWLESPFHFERHYGIPAHVLISACDGDNALFLNPSVAEKDSLNPEYLTKEERVLQLFKEVSTEMKNLYATDEYQAPRIYFGALETMMGHLGYTTPLFRNFKGFRTWSRWNKILFLAPVPNIDDLFDVEENGNMVLSQDLDRIMSTKSSPFINFYPEDDGLSKNTLLIRNMKRRLTVGSFKALQKSIKQRHKYQWVRVIFLFFTAFLEILSFLIQILLPLVILLAYIIIFYQLSRNKCITVGEFYFSSD